MQQCWPLLQSASLSQRKTRVHDITSFVQPTVILVIIIPLLFMWVYLSLYDTLQGLIILYAAVTFPFVVWLLRSFFQEVPREVSEAAIVDGCTHWGAFFI